MSTEQSSNDNNNNKKKDDHQVVIGLERPKPKDPRDKTAFVRFSCRNDPNDADSPTYELQVPYYDTGTPAELLELLAKVTEVQVGQDLTTGVEKYGLMRRVLKGAAKTEFDELARAQGNETNAHFTAVVEKLKENLFPVRALMIQKRALQKNLRKPSNMDMRTYASRMSELNELLLQFPPREAGVAPTKFEDYEIIQCIKDGLPYYYKTFMREHGFVPVNGTLSDFIKFVQERIEPTDTGPQPTKGKGKRKTATQSNDNGQNGKKKSQKRSSNKSNTQKGKDKTYWCTLCGEGDHSSNKCEEIKKFVAEKKSKGGNGSKKQFYHVEEVNAMLTTVANESADKAAKKVTKAWKKRSREEANAIDFPSTSSGSGSTIAKKLDVLEIDSTTTSSKSTLST